MKRILAIFIFLSTVCTLQAQIEVGIQFAPNISLNRISGLNNDGKINNYTINKNASGIRYSAGPIVDFFLKDNIALSTGLLFTIKRSSLEFAIDTNGSTKFDPVINIQYLQIPIAVKMYTNEIMSRVQLFFSLGGTLDARIAENVKEGQSVDFRDEFSKLVDAGLFLGAGIEKGVGQSNKVYAALTYNRGLINVITDDFHPVVNNDGGLKFNNDLLSLVIGFKF